MALRLNKKFTVIIAIVLFVIAAGAAVFVYIRINQEEEVTPDESEAGTLCSGAIASCPADFPIEAEVVGCECHGDCYKCAQVCCKDDGTGYCDRSNTTTIWPASMEPCPYGCDGGVCHTQPPAQECQPNNGSCSGVCGGYMEKCWNPNEGDTSGNNYDVYYCNGFTCTGEGGRCAWRCPGNLVSVKKVRGGSVTVDPELEYPAFCYDIQKDFLDGSGNYKGHILDPRDHKFSDPECQPEIDEPEYVNVRGKVFCQDPGESEQYPVQGARIVFQKSNGQNESVTTGPEGGFVTAQEQTELDQGPFSVVFDGITDPSRTLSNGWEYSEMTGPSLQNQTVCSRGSCGDCGDNYTSCTGFSEGTEAGFRWVFENCSGEPGVPGWDIEKTGNTVCYEENTEDVYAEIIYDVEITYTNTDSEEQGYIESVTDTYDPTIEQDWIISTDPEDSEITDTTITWNLSDEQRTFDVGESLVLHYTVRIPREGFEYTYQNQVDAEVQDSDETLSDDFSIWVTCEGYEPGPLPPTGVFDSTAVRIGLGIVLVGLGFAYYKFGWFDDSLLWLSDSVNKFTGKVRTEVTKEGRKSKWEKGLLSKVEDKSREE